MARSGRSLECWRVSSSHFKSTLLKAFGLSLIKVGKFQFICEFATCLKPLRHKQFHFMRDWGRLKPL
ncbi:hypothetical protein [Nostoc punctiforme]|uniref:hypothetical protein n=1 Tax=Nostoc punctiforme TaxID=272131 RepID=UPI001A7E4F05|nr:hypothetical protein [Nostoc punctiforme]